jgi:hypothetical protein
MPDSLACLRRFRYPSSAERSLIGTMKRAMAEIFYSTLSSLTPRRGTRSFKAPLGHGTSPLLIHTNVSQPCHAKHKVAGVPGACQPASRTWRRSSSCPGPSLALKKRATANQCSGMCKRLDCFTVVCGDHPAVDVAGRASACAKTSHSGGPPHRCMETLRRRQPPQVP